jgi:hypothetical protein
MCFEPLAIYAMPFRSFPMFARLHLTYRHIDGLSMHSPYYSIPIRHVPDLLRLCFDFICLGRYQHSDVSIIYSFGRLYYYHRFGLRSLRPLRGYSYSYLHSTLILQIVLRPPHLCETLYRFDSTSFYLAPSIFRRVSSRFINFARSLVIYIGLRIRTPSLVYIRYPIIFGSDIDSYISL